MLLNQMLRSSSSRFYLHKYVETNSRTITIPSSIRSGDLAVLISFGQRTGTTQNCSVSLSTGFTQRATDFAGSGFSTTGVTCVVATNILSGSEGGNSAYGLSDHTYTNYVTTLLIFRQAEGFTSISVGTTSDASSNNSSGQSLSYPSNTEILPFILIATAAIDDGWSSEESSISASTLSNQYYSGTNLTSIFVCIRHTNTQSSDTISSDLSPGTTSHYNFLNICTIQPV